MVREPKSFMEQAYRLGYPQTEWPPEYGQQWLEGEQASFDENPDACPYRIGSTEAFWWQQGFDAAEAVTAALSEDSENGEE